MLLLGERGGGVHPWMIFAHERSDFSIKKLGVPCDEPLQGHKQGQEQGQGQPGPRQVHLVSCWTSGLRNRGRALDLDVRWRPSGVT